ncbi:hypothetical protein BDV93DRAFT_590844 [Ceratobasidium sp. AG-I]|nr:hypothetical protein BDV93DRAFT_590844 [Ceratobasidium sp. AG-I]
MKFREQLKRDVKQYGKSPTPRQSLDTAARRKALAAKLGQHREEALSYVPAEHLQGIGVTAPASEGKPECLSTAVPSRLPGAAAPACPFAHAANSERILRRAICFKALQAIRATSIQKLHLLKAKRQVHGVIATTRAEGLISRLAERISHARWEYNSSRTQLIQLGLTAQEARTFKPLTDADLEGLTVALQGQDRLGDGYARVPWYWRVILAKDSDDADHVTTTGKALRAEYEESIRVEWFRSRERSRRWEEEVQWLQREAATIIVDYTARSDLWGHRGKNGIPGARAYCHKQAAVWVDLRADAFRLLTRPLNAGKMNCPLAQRALDIETYI